jgi:hypothetical protein
LLNITDLKRFGSPSLGVDGASDSKQGVQWSGWLDFRENVAYLAVNLEGMKYDDWPVARFIEREVPLRSTLRRP